MEDGSRLSHVEAGFKVKLQNVGGRNHSWMHGVIKVVPDHGNGQGPKP